MRFLIQICPGECLSSEIVNTGSEKTEWSETIYRAKGTQLLLYGRALGLSHAEAEDVLQETFMTLLERDRPAHPEHYCLRTYRNRALNYRRSVWRRIRREFESIRWFERAEDESPEEREAMQRLAQLPCEQREVIVLKIWHRYTFEEISGLLEISANTVAGRYRYGLEKLRKSLKGLDYERDERIGSTIALLGAASPVTEN
jgi:RNA polymerase sigma-70 factor (ECF subfamily)